MSDNGVVNIATLSRFFAVLALLTAVATLAIWVLIVVRRVRPSFSVGERLDDIAESSLWLGWVVATVTSAGSLYYSLGAGFAPCELCWYQRICIYPLSAVLLIAAVRRDRDIWRYALAPTLVGIALAGYHTQLQAFPHQQSFCSTTAPCTARYVWQFGFVSLPLMDLCALTFIATMLYLARTHQSEATP